MNLLIFTVMALHINILKKAGFSLLSQEDGNIIPNYFEPFERENVKIRIVVAHWPSFHLYRGDGDQDRPSIPRR